jgi:hypothetical protein
LGSGGPVERTSAFEHPAYFGERTEILRELSSIRFCPFASKPVPGPVGIATGGKMPSRVRDWKRAAT